MNFEKCLGDTFELIDVLKSTEQSFVALVYDKMSQRVCIMKRCNLQSLEIYRTLKDLSEPHVPEIYRIFECDDSLIVVEEHIDGQTLEEILTYQTLVVDEALALEILKQLCECLAVIHRANVVHRDIKPANIMLGKGNAVKLVDFGIARTFKPESRADTELLGTRGYAPPEQYGLFDIGQTDARSDIYSLGVTLKVLLGEDYRGGLLKILNRCTALNPVDRWQDTKKILAAIDNFDLPPPKRILRLEVYVVAFVAAFGIFFLPPKPLVDIAPPAAEPAEISVPIVAEKKSSVKHDTNFPQIDYSPPTIAPIEPPTVEPKQLPAPVELEKKFVKPRESVDGVDLYLYINGALTGTDSHIVDLGGWQSWTRHDNGVIFPADWSARLHIENHGTEDLIEPLITVSVGKEKFSVRKSAVKVGQALDLDIPLAEKFAAPLEGVGTLQIIFQAQGRNSIFLNRTFRLVK